MHWRQACYGSPHTTLRVLKCIGYGCMSYPLVKDRPLTDEERFREAREKRRRERYAPGPRRWDADVDERLRVKTTNCAGRMPLS